MKYMLLITRTTARVAKMDERMPDCAAYAETMKKPALPVASAARAAPTTRRARRRR